MPRQKPTEKVGPRQKPVNSVDPRQKPVETKRKLYTDPTGLESVTTRSTKQRTTTDTSRKVPNNPAARNLPLVHVPNNPAARNLPLVQKVPNNPAARNLPLVQVTRKIAHLNGLSALPSCISGFGFAFKKVLSRIEKFQASLRNSSTTDLSEYNHRRTWEARWRRFHLLCIEVILHDFERDLTAPRDQITEEIDSMIDRDSQRAWASTLLCLHSKSKGTSCVTKFIRSDDVQHKGWVPNQAEERTNQTQPPARRLCVKAGEVQRRPLGNGVRGEALADSPSSHFTTITYDLHGNFTPKTLHGAKILPASETDLHTITEHVLDSCHSRPLSSRKYRAMCMGGFLLAEATRRANFTVAYAADNSNRRAYWSHLGVNTFGSRKDLLENVPSDLVLASLSYNSEEELTSIVGYLRSSRIPSFFLDTSVIQLGELTSNKQMALFTKAGYTIKVGIAKANDHGVCAAIPRGHILGMRSDIALKIDFAVGPAPTGPISIRKINPKCVSDLMEVRRGEPDDTQIDLETWLAANQGWTVTWLEDMEHDALSRIEGLEKEAPIVLGYLHEKGKSISKHASLCICHVYGLVYPESTSDAPQGPGGTSAFYWDPLIGKARTLSLTTKKRIWHMVDLGDVCDGDLKGTSHPANSCTSMEVLALYLDKYFAESRTVPPTPRIKFECITDVFTPAALTKIESWKRRVAKWTCWIRKTKRISKAPAPLVMGDEAVQFWARGRTFKIIEGVPVRTERPREPPHEIKLHLLPLIHDYKDPDVVIITSIGFACGSNPAYKVVLHANDCGFIANEDEALKTFQTELALGWISIVDDIPHCPIWCSPHFLLWQATKWRRIYNYSKAIAGLSINQQRAFFRSAKLELVTLSWLSKELLQAARKVVFLREKGISATYFLFVVDLFKAYNQLSVDARDQWHTCSTFVGKDGLFKFIELLVTAFGPEKAPMVFSRITKITTYSIDQQLDATKEYPLQDEYRKLRRGALEAAIPASYDTDGLPKLGVEVKVKSTRNARKLDELYLEWDCEDEVKELLPNEQLLRPGISTSEEDAEKLYALATYLDDCFGLFITTTAIGGRRPHKDGSLVSSNSSVVRFSKNKTVGSASGRDRAEALRMEFVRKTYETAGLKVVNDERSQRKWDDGKCDTVMRILGVIIDATDPLDPTVALPEEKRKELHLLLQTCLSNRENGLVTVCLDEYQSLLGKLNNGTKACKRGKTHLCGLFKALRGGKQMEAHEKLTLGPWQERNLMWWARVTETEMLPESLFDKIPTLEKRYCGHSDAATGVGYGGFCNRKGGHTRIKVFGSTVIKVEKDTCYYIKGEWNTVEKKLIDTQTEEFEGKRMGINFLEMATVGMLIAATKAIGGFEDNCSKFYCDNETTVKVLNSHKTRTLPLCTLLENIDLETTKRNINLTYEWIATKKNIESDLLSRGLIEEFKAYIRKTYQIYEFVELQVPAEARRMGEVCDNARRNPHWIVPDGASNEGI